MTLCVCPNPIERLINRPFDGYSFVHLGDKLRAWSEKHETRRRNRQEQTK